MTGPRGLAIALGLSLAVHAGLALGLRALGVYPEAAPLPPLLVDLVEPVVVPGPAAAPRGGTAERRARSAAEPDAGLAPPAVPAAPPRGAPRVAELPPGARPLPGPPAPLAAQAATPADARPAAGGDAVPSPAMPAPGFSLPWPVPVPAAGKPATRFVVGTPRAIVSPAPAAPGPGLAAGERSGPAVDAAPGDGPSPAEASGASAGGGSSVLGVPGVTAGRDRPQAGEESHAAAAAPVGLPGEEAVAALGARRSVEAPPEYEAYVRALRRRIQERLVYPWLAIRQGLEGMIEIEVELDAAGRLDEVAVVRGGERSLLRDAALRAVRDATPYPFPHGIAARALRIRLPVVFELK